MQIKNPGLIEKLEKAGFSDKEALVYLSVLELGGAYPSKIAEYSGIKRSTVYAVLLNLTIRGLVSEIEKKNKLYYQIDRPEKIIRFAKTQIDIAEDRLEKAKSFVPEIEGLFAAYTNKPKVSYFEGTGGMVAIYQDMLNQGKKYEMLAFSNASELEKVFPAQFFEHFRRTKEKMGITTRGLIPDTPSDRTYNERFFNGDKPEIVPKFKYIPAKDFPFKGELTIYGDNKVSVVNLNKEYLTGVIIEDRTIHEMTRMIFELSWQSKAVTD